MTSRSPPVSSNSSTVSARSSASETATKGRHGSLDRPSRVCRSCRLHLPEPSLPRPDTSSLAGGEYPLPTDVAQHGNLRLSDQAEAEILDSLRAAAAELLGAPVVSVAVVGGASEGLGQLAALLSSPDGEVILVPSDFPSVTYPWLAAHERSGMRIRWVPDVATKDLTQSMVDAISERTTVVCVSAVQFSTGTQCRRRGPRGACSKRWSPGRR